VVVLPAPNVPLSQMITIRTLPSTIPAHRHVRTTGQRHVSTLRFNNFSGAGDGAARRIAPCARD
jgi:hypothetical protein